jgi:hypothetical protein
MRVDRANKNTLIYILLKNKKIVILPITEENMESYWKISIAFKVCKTKWKPPLHYY